MDELRKKVKLLIEQQARYEKIQGILICLQNELLQKQQTHKKFESQLSKEEADVIRLEKKTVSKIIHSLIGNLENKLSKEQEEVVKARAKYRISLQEVEENEYQIHKLEEELESLKYCHDELLISKEQLKNQMMKTHEGANELLVVDNQIVLGGINIKEIKEAIAAGEHCLEILGKVKKKLSSASGWSTIDIIGGGVISDLMKYDKMDKAQIEMNHFQQGLLSFKKELSDLNDDVTSQMFQFSTVEKFFDIAFDNIFSDISTSMKIDKRLSDVFILYKDIEKRVQDLKVKEKHEVIDYEALNVKLNQLIIR